MSQWAIEVEELSHRYGQLLALDGVSFRVREGAIFGFLGPNGGGKSTLFGVLGTLLGIQSGSVRALGFDVSRESIEYRRRLGITFQSPSLDKRLTVRENLVYQGQLYGLFGRVLDSVIDELLVRFRVADRAADVVSSLSGGLKRRVELAKCFLHRPRLLVLDEPSTGLDPGARRDLWELLEQLRTEDGTTIVVTTHLMDEAERCDQLGLLDKGQLVAEGSPSALRGTVPGECVTIVAELPEELRARIAAEMGLNLQRVGETLRLQRDQGQELFRELMERYGNEFRSISLGKPTLEDVFLAKTGRVLGDEGASV